MTTPTQSAVSPSDYGAVGDGKSHPASSSYSTLAQLQAVYPFATDLSQEMDWLAWQAALNAGGYVFSQPRRYVMCNANVASQKPLTMVAGRSWVMGSGAQLDFSAMTAQATVTNCGVLLTRDGAAEHYPIRQPLEGVELIGPGASVGVTGVLWKSVSSQDGDLVDLRFCSVHGWGTGLMFSDGAYLTEVENVEIEGCGTAVSYQGGNNAGENLRFKGGGIYNNAVGINNAGGAEMTLFGTAIDYNTQAIIQNAGRIELHGVHAEMEVPATAGLPLFQCQGVGSIAMFGGKFLGAGGVGTAAEPPINLVHALSSFTFHGTEIYNLSSAAGVACSGAGMLSAQGWTNNGNPNIGPILLGQQISMDAFGGAGKFEPQTGPLIAPDPTGIFIPGAIYAQPGATVTNRWTTQFLSAAISTARAFSGTRSLQITKSGEGSGGADNQIVIPVPVRQGQDVWLSFYWLQPANVGQGTASLYARLYWVQAVGTDTYGRPIFGQQTVSIAEYDIQLPLAGASTWTNWRYSSAFVPDTTDPTIGRAPGAPAWATHLALLLDTESLPAMSFFIDQLQANVL